MSLIHSGNGFQISSPDNANLICFRDPAQLLREEIDELSKVQPLPFNLMSKLEFLNQDNLALKAEVKERESELEDLGCWRAILLRRRRPTKKLTQVIMKTNMMGIRNGHWRFSIRIGHIYNYMS